MDLIIIILVMITVLIDFILLFLDIINCINLTPMMLITILFMGGVISVIYLIISIIYELISIHKGGSA